MTEEQVLAFCLRYAGVRMASATLTRNLLDPISETLGLTETELASLFGIKRQAIGQWRARGLPSARQEKAASIAAICDLLGHQLRPERIPGIARRPARAYRALTMLEMIEADRHEELRGLIERSFDWTTGS
ncbi:hypothetical protein BH20ACT15_BH20ACT15_14470 [soil metagenome]